MSLATESAVSPSEVVLTESASAESKAHSEAACEPNGTNSSVGPTSPAPHDDAVHPSASVSDANGSGLHTDSAYLAPTVATSPTTPSTAMTVSDSEYSDNDDDDSSSGEYDSDSEESDSGDSDFDNSVNHDVNASSSQDENQEHVSSAGATVDAGAIGGSSGASSTIGEGPPRVSRRSASMDRSKRSRSGSQMDAAGQENPTSTATGQNQVAASSSSNEISGKRKKKRRTKSMDKTEAMKKKKRRDRGNILGEKKERVRENTVGELIYKGHKSFEIMNNLQLGIRVSISKITPLRAPETLTQADFAARVKVYFPTQGSLETPPHHFRSFKFKEYAPMVFRKLRETFGIDAGDFMLSICGDNSLRELRTAGKSGALFYFSEDMQYIIKTLTHNEGKFFRRILPQYYQHIVANKDTMLSRFYGMFRIKPHSGRKIRLIIMNNIFPADRPIVTKYDLKGSTLGRCASDEELKKPGCIRKDLNLVQPIPMNGKREEFLEQVRRDARFLSKQNIMDYSLLLGIDSNGGYHMGIIDILQDYDWRKWFEHQFKAIAHDRYAMSAVPPKAYAKRFIKFLEEKTS
eukprot:ANDGO_02910.mRNA.1 Phosphatidylinositol 4-phosphate 5-kinase 9